MNNHHNEILLTFEHVFFSSHFFSKRFLNNPCNKSCFLFWKIFTIYLHAMEKAPKECMEMKVTLQEKYGDETCR